jgi:hypothetical protein
MSLESTSALFFGEASQAPWAQFADFLFSVSFTR